MSQSEAVFPITTFNILWVILLSSYDARWPKIPFPVSSHVNLAAVKLASPSEFDPFSLDTWKEEPYV